jgi:hypothetical protein
MMRAITIRQPFADAIVLGKKRIENRTKHLGAQPGEWIAIHAAKQHYAEGDGAFLRSDALRTKFGRLAWPGWCRTTRWRTTPGRSPGTTTASCSTVLSSCPRPCRLRVRSGSGRFPR